MSGIVKPAVRNSWADLAANPADIVDPGNTFAAAGWLNTGVPPSRQYFNWVLNYCSNAVRYFCRRGVSDWDASETYVVGDVVLGPNLILVQSQINPNVGQNPTTNTSAWAQLNAYALNSAFAFYTTTANLMTLLSGYVLSTTLATTLTNYVTNAYLTAYYAPLLSPALTGFPTAPTRTFGQNDGTIANTQFVQQALAGYAPLASPALTGNPTAPTQASSDNSTRLATTAFVQALAGISGTLSSNGSMVIPIAGTAFSVTINWGNGSVTGGSLNAVTFSSAYTSACYSIVTNVVSAISTTESLFTSAPSNSKTGFNIGCTSNASYSWIAIGV